MLRASSVSSFIVDVSLATRRGSLSTILVRNFEHDKGILYIHWVDYHKRYWTVDIDSISDLAKRIHNDADGFMDSVHFVRMFSKDCTESKENWRMIADFGKNLNLIVLDSVSELFETNDKRRRADDASRRIYSMGMFMRLCQMNCCHGLILDTLSRAIHPFLGEISSIIIKLFYSEGIVANVIKHPCMISQSVKITSSSRHGLGRWMG